MPPATLRVLALDGGGIRGVFTAAVLDELENLTDRKICDYFDLIVGTSTGGIIGLGIGAGFDPGHILDVYKDKGSDIFPSVRDGLFGWLSRWFESRYDSDGLRVALATVFGEKLFSDSAIPLAITSFNAEAGKPKVLKSGYLDNGQRGYAEATMVDVAMATSAAPTYFPAAEAAALGTMLDGGVWANCPVMVGLTEAIGSFQRRPASVRILNIGTTTSPFSVPDELNEAGPVQWAKPIPGLLMHANRVAAIEMAKKMGAHVVRVDEVVEPGRFDMDDVAGTRDLEILGREKAMSVVDEVKAAFLHRRVRRGP